MRVLLVSGSLPPQSCGVGAYTLKLAEALATDRQTTVGILTGRRDGQPAPSDRIDIIPVMDRWQMREFGALMAAIRAWNPDVVHVQYPTQGYCHSRLPSLVPLIARLLGCRAISTWHEIYGLCGLPRFLLQAWPSAAAIVVRPNFEDRLPPLLRRLTAGRRRTFIAQASSIPRSAASAETLSALRAATLQGRQRLVVFFGFVHAQKGVDLLFKIADPATDHLVIAGPADVSDPYLAELHERAERPPWQGHVTFTGFLSEPESADLLAAADAVVLPFRQGGGIWNSSIHAAVQQGTLVVTTSMTDRGLDPDRHVHSSAPGDVTGMRAALDRLAGTRRASSGQHADDDWSHIGARHRALYAATLATRDDAEAVPPL